MQARFIKDGDLFIHEKKSHEKMFEKINLHNHREIKYTTYYCVNHHKNIFPVRWYQ